MQLSILFTGTAKNKHVLMSDWSIEQIVFEGYISDGKNFNNEALGALVEKGKIMCNDRYCMITSHAQ